MRKTVKVLTSALIILGFLAPTPAADPPELINYQGVLRDASTGKPLDGDYYMVFRLYDLPDPGTGELLFEDAHTWINEVEVEQGLFNVRLGEHHNGGIYSSLAEMFANEPLVYLEIEISAPGGSGEKLAPRTQIVSAGYALNAMKAQTTQSAETCATASDAEMLGGQLPNYYLNTSGNPQTKSSAATSVTLVHDFFGDDDKYGLSAKGETAGALFQLEQDPSVKALLGWMNNSGERYGMGAAGTTAGALIKDADANDSGESRIGFGDTGIDAKGDAQAGLFQCTSGDGFARVGYSNRGIDASGSEDGGVFRNGSSLARLAYEGDTTRDRFGIWAKSEEVPGYFTNTSSDATAEAYLAYHDHDAEFERGIGIQAGGDLKGAYFYEIDATGEASIASGNTGIIAAGDSSGGYFEDSDSGTYTRVASGSYKLESNGSSSSFIQNHPVDKGLTIVYAAPEGDEVATYTRGVAQLENGEARVELGETFQYVTNPDIGLTGHLTPRGDCNGLYIASLTTREVVVRELKGGATDVVFDYQVWGLRIGFEDRPIVRPKREEAYLPLVMETAEYERHPELRRHSALSRYERSRRAIGGAGVLDLSASQALVAAIGRYDPAVHARQEVFGVSHGAPQGRRRGESTKWPDSAPGKVSGSIIDGAAASDGGAGSSGVGVGAAPGDSIRARSFHSVMPELASYQPVTGVVQNGDVLVIDPENPEALRRASSAFDPTVVGVVVDAPGVVLGSEELEGEVNGSGGSESKTEIRRIPVALSGIVRCRVDAAYGDVQPGDLLVSSPTPGHVMRAPDPLPGTVVGKALESLIEGQGIVRILVMPR